MGKTSSLKVNTTKKKKKKPWRNIFVLLELKEKQRSSTENQRVKEFLRKKAEIDALPTQRCKNNCGDTTIVPMEFCSTKCKDEYEEKYNETRTHKKTKRTLGKIE